MPFQAKLRVQLDTVFSSVLDLATSYSNLPLDLVYELTDGTLANQANNIWSDTRTVGISATDTLDLSGVLANAFGALVSFTKVRAILIAASPSNTVILNAGPAAANGFLGPWNAAVDRTKIVPGGVLLLYAPNTAGWAVTPGTADQMVVVNGAGNTSTYSIVIIGVQ
jgi:hypothetical protein